MTPLFRPSSPHGFSIVEILLTVGLIAVVSSVSVLAVSRINELSRNQKLENDVRTLNTAISSYLASGGSLTGLTTPAQVLAKLKTTLSKEDRRLHVGAPSGRMIDPRIAAVSVAADGSKPRARYNTGTARFEIAGSGEGVEFVLDESLAEVAAITEKRGGAVSYSKNSGWVWDHASTNNPNAPGGPSRFNTNPNVTDTNPVTSTPPPPPIPAPPIGGSPPAPPAPVIPNLPLPQFDLAEGAHPEEDFPLVVSITNVPDSSIGSAIYQIGSGPWMPYSASVEVPMNQHLRAQFLSKNQADYKDSSVRTAYYYPVPDSLSGTVDGNFANPVGGPNLVYSITGDGDKFTHGDPVFILDGTPINSGDSNVLSFSPKSFTNIPPGQAFVLGHFYYRNGSTYYDSHAIGVTLGITISLPDRGQTIPFNLKLDLVNTENDPDDAHSSADYVRITNLSQDIPLQINGVNYRIKLQFGATDSFGFSNQSEFHVYEGATGEGELLGTFLPR